MLGAALRVLPLRSAEPYMAYIDEGNFLHPAFKMVRDGTWNPGEYLYPQFPRLAVAAVSTVVDRASRRTCATPLRDRIPRDGEPYDELEPFAFLLAARVLGAAAGLATIVMTGLLAERLAPGAGATAALLAALVPALALRGSIASVDAYATVAVLACLYATDRSRTSERPRRAALAAGACAGWAFASKYPSILVFLAFAGTTVLLSLRPADKAARLALGGAGVLIGALLAMPALWRHSFDVYDALKQQRVAYGQFSADSSLWSQALVRAESGLRFAGPEIGTIFVALAVLGLVVGLRRRDQAPTVAGWCVFAGASFLLYGTQRFRPFRNLMPLVPIGCIAVAVAYDWIRDRVPRPRWLDAVASAGVLMFAVPVASHVRDRMELVDSRRQAIDWLASRSRPGDGIVYLQELAILEGELARLPLERWPASASDADVVVEARSPRFVIAGIVGMPDQPSVDLTALPVLRSDYEPVFRIGATRTVPVASWWHGNDQIVEILERRATTSAAASATSVAPDTAMPSRTPLGK